MKNNKCNHVWENTTLNINGFPRASRRCTKCTLYQIDAETDGLTNRILPFMGFDDQTTF